MSLGELGDLGVIDGAENSPVEAAIEADELRVPLELIDAAQHVVVTVNQDRVDNLSSGRSVV